MPLTIGKLVIAMGDTVMLFVSQVNQTTIGVHNAVQIPPCRGKWLARSFGRSRERSRY